MMRTSFLLVAAAVLALASPRVAVTATEKKPAALLSPALSINPVEGQPICLVSNLSATATVSVSVEIFDATGTSAVSTQLTLPPAGIDAATDVLSNFYSYCRITPQDPAQLSLLRGSHCVASGNTVRTCLEAR
jgi:hypothetical protein